MSKPEYSLITEADEEELLNQQRSPYCMLCQAQHTSCLDDDEIELFDELDLWDDEEDEDDWEDEYDG